MLNLITKSNAELVHIVRHAPSAVPERLECKVSCASCAIRHQRVYDGQRVSIAVAPIL